MKTLLRHMHIQERQSVLRGDVQRKHGFTLVELAIVLAVAGLLFVGLWRLLASGNQQVRDQSAASQQTQLISAVKGYLASAQGQVFLGNIAASTATNLPLPTSNPTPGTCANGTILATVNQFCNFLPAGFTSTTPNSYGQTYTIQVLKDSTVAPTPPNTYSFMIVTSGGDTIPDSSGGRISAFIGNDGGFIYNSNVCNATFASWACGAYGAWSAAVTTYGFTAPAAGGFIASRTYVSPLANNQLPWLSRPVQSGDTTYFVWNTMSTDLYMGGTSQVTGTTAGNIYLYPPAGSPAIGAANFGSINLGAPGGANCTSPNCGVINMQGGSIVGTGTSNIGLTADSTMSNPVIIANNPSSPNCPMLTPGQGASGACSYAISTSSINVSTLVNANALYAGTFLYTSSDMRLKTNIKPLTNTLGNVMKLKPVSFAFKSNGKEGLGVIAQDLEKVYPQLVTQQGGGMKSVNYEGLIGPLIGAVQELKIENDDLRQKLKAQEKHEEQLEQEIKRGKSE